MSSQTGNFLEGESLCCYKLPASYVSFSSSFREVQAGRWGMIQYLGYKAGFRIPSPSAPNCLPRSVSRVSSLMPAGKLTSPQPWPSLSIAENQNQSSTSVPLLFLWLPKCFPTSKSQLLWYRKQTQQPIDIYIGNRRPIWSSWTQFCVFLGNASYCIRSGTLVWWAPTGFRAEVLLSWLKKKKRKAKYTFILNKSLKLA